MPTRRPPPPVGWTGKGAAGAVLARGNADTTTADVKFDGTDSFGNWKKIRRTSPSCTVEAQGSAPRNASKAPGRRIITSARRPSCLAPSPARTIGSTASPTRSRSRPAWARSSSIRAPPTDSHGRLRLSSPADRDAQQRPRRPRGQSRQGPVSQRRCWYRGPRLSAAAHQDREAHRPVSHSVGRTEHCGGERLLHLGEHYGPFGAQCGLRCALQQRSAPGTKPTDQLTTVNLVYSFNQPKK